MTQILALLTLYYACDQAAAHRGLHGPEVTSCMANYEVLKLAFIDEAPAPLGSPERAAQIRLGYTGFKLWEAENADLVEEMREQARDRLDLG